MSVYCEMLGMPLVNTVARAGPGLTFQLVPEMKDVSEKPVAGSSGRNRVSSLSMRCNCSRG